MSLSAPFKYAYVSAKVSALLSKLLTSSQYRRLMDAESLGDALKSLLETPYGSAVADLEVREDFSLLLDKAVSGKVSKDMARILRHSPKRARSFLSSLVEQEEYRALKSVIKAVVAGVDISYAISKIAPFGRYTADVCLDIIKKGSVEDALGYVEDSYLWEELSSIIGKKSVFEVDMIIERHSAQKIISESKRLKGLDKVKMSALLGYEADIRNIVSALRAVNLGLSVDDAKRFWIPFHRGVTEEELVRMVEAGDVAQSFSFIPDMYRGVFHGLSGGGQEFISNVEMYGERYLAKKYLGTLIGFRIHIGLIWVYLRLLMYEASDIRTILIGKLYNFRPTEIESKLILFNLH